MLVSIIVPVLNDSDCLVECLSAIQAWRGDEVEIIVVDGGSEDNSVAVAKGLADQVLVSARGRSLQMNAGANMAKGEVLLFLHADTKLPKEFAALIGRWKQRPLSWGFFPVRLSGQGVVFRLTERCMNWRSKLTHIATGDQCLFFNKNLFLPLGGFEPIPIMEDVAICKRIRRVFQPEIVQRPVITSTRRWEKFGVIKTMVLMWWLRLLYFLGKSPHKIARHY